MDVIPQPFSAPTVITAPTAPTEISQTDTTNLIIQSCEFELQSCKNVLQSRRSDLQRMCAVAQVVIIVSILNKLDCFTNEDFDPFTKNLSADTDHASFDEINKWFLKLNQLIEKIPFDYQIKSDEELKCIVMLFEQLKKLTSSPVHDALIDDFFSKFLLIIKRYKIQNKLTHFLLKNY